jgi:hypothetical protein
MVLLSVTGFLRTLLIIIGVFVLLRFLGQLMRAKRNIEAERLDNAARREEAARKEESKRNLGKTTITQIGKTRYKDEDYTDYEEI